MVLYPDFDASGWTFIGIACAMWTGIIMVLSVISNLFGLYRMETFNKLISFILLCGIMYSLLWYFPQEDKVTPINKIKYGEIPTKADIEKASNVLRLILISSTATPAGKKISSTRILTARK